MATFSTNARAIKTPAQNDSNKQNAKGFTLVELMIVIAIIAIIAAFVYPSYTQNLVEARRSAALACLSEYSQWMERYYTANMSYSSASLPNKNCKNDLKEYYSFSFAAKPKQNSFTLQANAKGAQLTRDKKCKILTLDNSNARTPKACWSK